MVWGGGTHQEKEKLHFGCDCSGKTETENDSMFFDCFFGYPEDPKVTEHNKNIVLVTSGNPLEIPSPTRTIQIYVSGDVGAVT